MNETKQALSGPDLAKGVALSKVADGAMLLGHAPGEPVLLARRGDELFAIGAVVHAEHWDKAEMDGQLDARDCSITYRRGGKQLAVATVHRDMESLRAEVELERTTGGQPSWRNNSKSAITSRVAVR